MDALEEKTSNLRTKSLIKHANKIKGNTTEFHSLLNCSKAVLLNNIRAFCFYFRGILFNYLRQIYFSTTILFVKKFPSSKYLQLFRGVLGGGQLIE